MYLNHVALPILYQVLTTTALSLGIVHPDSLFQDHNTTSARLQRPNPSNGYYVECERVRDPPLPGLNPFNCIVARPFICAWLANLRPETYAVENWLWMERPGCALGFFLPRFQHGEPLELPTEEECNRDIYGAIIEQCAYDSRYNVGSINVVQLPRGHGQPGEPMTEGFARYAMAPQQL